MRIASRLIAALVLSGALGGGPGSASAGAAPSGQRLFLRCKSCHELSVVSVGKIGPSLKGIVGRPAGSVTDYKYSPALKAQKFVWTEAMLDRWLTRPTDVVAGTAMAFAGLPDQADRQALIAYLKLAAH